MAGTENASKKHFGYCTKASVRQLPLLEVFSVQMQAKSKLDIGLDKLDFALKILAWVLVLRLASIIWLAWRQVN